MTESNIREPFFEKDSQRSGSEKSQEKAAVAVGEPVEEPSNTVFYLKVYNNVTHVNLIGILTSSMLAFGSCSFMNVQTVTLLQDSFDVPKDDVGRVSAKILTWAYVFSIFSALTAGYIYDIFGRRITITLTLLLTAGCMIILPITIPSLFLFCILKTCIDSLYTATASLPLIVDYVRPQDHGKAASLYGLGAVLGEAVAMTTVIVFSSLPGSVCVPLFGMGLAGLSVLNYFTIREREDITGYPARMQEEADEFAALSKCDKLKALTSESWQLCKNNVKYFLLMACNFVSRQVAILTTYFLVLWVHDLPATALKEGQDADQFYGSLMLAAAILGITCIPFSGIIVDRINDKVMVTGLYLVRGICTSPFTIYGQEMSTWMTYAAVVGTLAFSFLQLVSVYAMYFRGLPKNLSGTMSGILMLFGQFGGLFMSNAGGYLHDNVSSNAPFTLFTLLDLSMFVLLVIGFTCRAATQKKVVQSDEKQEKAADAYETDNEDSFKKAVNQ